MDAARWVAVTLAAALDGWLPSCSGCPAAPQGRDPARRQAPTPTGEPNHFADLESGGFESHITKPGRATAPRVGNSLLSNLLKDVPRWGQCLIYLRGTATAASVVVPTRLRSTGRPADGASAKP